MDDLQYKCPLSLALQAYFRDVTRCVNLTQGAASSVSSRNCYESSVLECKSHEMYFMYYDPSFDGSVWGDFLLDEGYILVHEEALSSNSKVCVAG
jgi:hypothetical protein